MAFVPTANAAKVALESLVFGQQLVNTLYFQHDAPIDVTDLGLLAFNIADWYTTEVLNGGLSNSVIFQRSVATDLTSATAPSITNTSFAGTTGGNSSPVLPNNNSIAISFRTAERGRSSRGRNFLGGLTESAVVANVVDAGIRAAMLSAYALLLPGGGAMDPSWVWSVLSLFTAGAPRVAGLTIPINAVTFADDVVDSQRKRLPGRGR